jgi:hypothetical protein
VVSLHKYKENVKKFTKNTCSKFPTGSLSTENATVLPNAWRSTAAFQMIIIIINSILDSLSSQLSSLSTRSSNPSPISSSSSSSLLSKQFPIPCWFLHIEREREREIKPEEPRREAESSLKEESAAVEHFPSTEIEGPTSPENDIEEIGGQSRFRAR